MRLSSTTIAVILVNMASVRRATYISYNILKATTKQHSEQSEKWCATEDSVNLSNKILDLLDCNITENVAINCKNVQQG